MSFRPTSLAAALVASLAFTASASAQGPGPVRDTVAAVDQVFAHYSSATPGCAVGVARGGRELLARGYGMAELEHGVPITPATIFEAGSVSKQFTAFIVLLLEQDGKLSLGDPLRKHLPELPDYGAPLTIAQVLSHTSGLRDWFGLAAVEGRPSGEHHFRNEDLLDIASRQRALNFPSGSEYLYSNTGWNLLALVVERVTGESFQSFSRRRVFEPLGMSHTRWRDDFRAVVPGRAASYAQRDGGWMHQMPFTSAVGAGGLLTTVHDLLRWNENLSTGRVGGKALVDRMQARARLTSGKEIEYGFGLAIRDARGTREVAHGGSTGGYRSHVVRYPEHGLSMVILCNETRANPAAAASAIADVFLGPEARQTAAPRAASDEDGERVAAAGRGAGSWTPDAAALREYAGAYFTDEAPATWRAVAQGDTLVLEGPGRRRVVLRPTQRDTFAAPGLGTVVFRRDARGQVDAVSFRMTRVRDLRLDRR